MKSKMFWLYAAAVFCGMGIEACTPEEKTDLIGVLALSAGRHLGFTAEELIGTLKNSDDKYTRKAIELVARAAIGSKEYQKHGETRND